MIRKMKCTEKECLPNFKFKFKFLENFKETPHTQKTRKSFEKKNKLAENLRKIHCKTSEFHVKFHAKNRYRASLIYSKILYAQVRPKDS